jgi:hypothetical protein
MGNRRSRSGVGCQPLSKRTATCFMRPLRAEAQAHRGQTATKLKSRYGSTIESLPELSGGPRLDETQADFRLLASSHTPLKKSIILVSAVSYEDDSRRVVNDFHSEGSPMDRRRMDPASLHGVKGMDYWLPSHWMVNLDRFSIDQIPACPIVSRPECPLRALLTPKRGDQGPDRGMQSNWRSIERGRRHRTWIGGYHVRSA